MKPDRLLAIDVGTQSVRALVFDLQGHVLARSQAALEPPFVAPQPGWAEQDALTYWSAMGTSCRALWAGGADPLRIAGLALTTQRGTVVSAREDGTPLRPAIVWPDQRLCSALPRLGARWKAAFALAGASGLVHQLQRQAECNWLAQHDPRLWQHTERYALLSGWLTQRLVGDWVDGSACQVGYLPFDHRLRQWAPAGDWRWQALTVQPAQLPRLLPPAARLGPLTGAAAAHLGLPARAAGWPLVAAAADKACEVLGCGALDPGTAHLSFGTAAAINTTQPRYMEVQRLLPAYPAALPGAWNTEVHIQRGFWLVSWFMREFGQPEAARAAALGVAPETLLDALLSATPPGAQGLVLQPFWSPGLRDPGPEAKGAVLGFGDVHTRAHLYRAVIEGLVYGLRAGREQIERKLGRRLTRLVVSGGGAQSDGVMQIAADVFNLPAERAAVTEASALGAAMLCAAGLGLHADVPAAVRAMARTGRVFMPDAAAVRTCDALYREVYAPLYGRLAPLYRRIRAITGYPG
jgi:sugar (pentulose or hexulose) kinase